MLWDYRQTHGMLVNKVSICKQMYQLETTFYTIQIENRNPLLGIKLNRFCGGENVTLFNKNKNTNAIVYSNYSNVWIKKFMKVPVITLYVDSV